MINIDKDFLRKVWGSQPKGSHVVVCSKDPRKSKEDRPWTEKAFDDPELALEWLAKQSPKVDVYFCATWLNGKARRKNNVVGSKYLWSDLDEVDPRKLEESLKPSIAWESSPGRYQALWEIQESASPKEIEETNKALAYAIGADKSGFDLTQVLRIPGAPNNKYPEAPISKLLWHKDKPADLKKIRLALDIKTAEADKFDEPEVTEDLLSFEELLSRKRKQIGHKILSTLLVDEAPEGKRSDVIWWLGHELVKKGLTAKEVLILIKGSAWNKYAGRRDEDERLTHEIARAIEDEIIENVGSTKKKEKKDKHDLTEEEVEEKASKFSFTVESDTEVMCNADSEPGWLVEGWWTKKSHGIVSGEPKSFKSTLVSDLCLAIASGEPFLGKYPVVEKGPVLVIQNENARWIIKDRNAKIRAHKGLVGEMKKLGPRKYQFLPPPELPIYYVNQQGFNLNDPVHRKLFEKMLATYKPILTVLDPLYLMFDGDINSAKDLNSVLSWLLLVKEKYGTGIIVVHHWNKGGTGHTSRGGQRMLGSTTLHGWTESAWYIGVKPTEQPAELDEGNVEGKEDVAKAGGVAAVTVEREFRGAGMYPKADLLISMGEFGTDEYTVDVTKHVPVVVEKKTRGGGGSSTKPQLPSKEVVKETLVTEMGMSNKPIPEKRLLEIMAVSKKSGMTVINELLNDGAIYKKDNGYLLVR